MRCLAGIMYCRDALSRIFTEHGLNLSSTYNGWFSPQYTPIPARGSCFPLFTQDPSVYTTTFPFSESAGKKNTKKKRAMMVLDC